MGTRVAARQVLRWAVVKAPSSRCTGGTPLCRPLCRPLCSQDALQPHGHDVSPPPRRPVPGLSLHSLVEMGFTDSQAERISEATSSPRGGGVARRAPATLAALFVLGLNPSSVLKVLEKCPELYSVSESQLQQRVTNLRKLGLVEGSLQRVVCHYPQILSVPVKAVRAAVLLLREKCRFTAQQVTDLLRDSPAVVQAPAELLELQFQVGCCSFSGSSCSAVDLWIGRNKNCRTLTRVPFTQNNLQTSY
ncbi:Transcription termination factor 4, mitochondrial [Liparis tanakae]|uniref:Transcription termination factor 4, mitochondrial n=1 Tax=Liparis tanakae TaxID=230148 RepID=A0A4Z2F6N2_9TELE|nr:Transcription termination factor 4, mitochondrial [Liparis tanakae]